LTPSRRRISLQRADAAGEVMRGGEGEEELPPTVGPFLQPEQAGELVARGAFPETFQLLRRYLKLVISFLHGHGKQSGCGHCAERKCRPCLRGALTSGRTCLIHGGLVSPRVQAKRASA